VNPLFMGLQNWSAPAVAHAYADRSLVRFRSFVIRAACMFLLAMPPMLLALGLLSNPLLHHVYHDLTPGTLLIVLVLLAESVVQSSSFVISRGLFSLGRGDLDLWANFVPIAVLLVAGYFLIHHYGATGAAACLLAALVLSTAVRTSLFLKVTAARRAASQPAVNAMEGIVPAEAM
jgi:O-antigen/teichoic acid export membrane protein